MPPQNWHSGRLSITDTVTKESRGITLGAQSKKGWNDMVLGRSVGGPASGADIPLDEPLDGVDLGIFPASNHLILWAQVGPGAILPDISFEDYPDRPKAAVQGGSVHFRFDGCALRIGRHVLRWGSSPG